MSKLPKRISYTSPLLTGASQGQKLPCSKHFRNTCSLSQVKSLNKHHSWVSMTIITLASPSTSELLKGLSSFPEAPWGSPKLGQSLLTLHMPPVESHEQIRLNLLLPMCPPSTTLDHRISLSAPQSEIFQTQHIPPPFHENFWAPGAPPHMKSSKQGDLRVILDLYSMAPYIL